MTIGVLVGDLSKSRAWYKDIGAGIDRWFGKLSEKPGVKDQEKWVRKGVEVHMRMGYWVSCIGNRVLILPVSLRS